MTRTTNAVADAYRAVQDAEARITEAEQARDEARNRLDIVLDARGWSRMHGAFSPGVRLYTSPISDAALNVDQLIAYLERMDRAAA